MSKQGITELNYDREFLHRGFAEMPGGFFIYRADWEREEILYVNRALLEIFECGTEEEFLELSGGSFRGLVHPDDYSIVEMSLRMQISDVVDNYDRARHRIITKNGNVVHVELHSKYVETPEEGPLFYAFLSESQTNIDDLTRLPKRLYFFELAPKLAEQIREMGENAVVLAFDFNNMKGYNSRYGLEAGDRLLTRMADLLAESFGIENCSRFGEDHFYVCTGDTDLEMKLKKLIAEIDGKDRSEWLSVRIGIALYEPDTNVGEVCDMAKFASDTIDNVNSAYVWYDEKIYRDISNREYVLNNVERALSEGWIEPFYQPVIRALTGRLCSVEALARWQDPERGLISPGDFIPVMEEKGLIYKLDMYIVERVVSVLQQRQKEGLPVVPVSVNVSCSDFDYCDPVEIIASICDAHGVRRNLICAEITETALMRDRSMVRDAVERFHKAGIDVWMDDFGSGYSSLSILRDLDFDEVKIDMGFLRNFNDRAKTIVIAAVRMAKQLGVHTLAEGVENQEHLDFLKNIGCERIQGYYYGKPLPLSEFMDHIKEKGIIFESREISALYQKAGLVDLISDRPMALIFFDGRQFSTVFTNRQFKKELEYTGLTEEQAETAVTKMGSLSVGPRFHRLAENAVASGKREWMTFIYRNRHYRFSFQVIGSIRSGSMLSATLEYVAFDEQNALHQRGDVMRNLFSLYNSIYMLDYEEDICSVVASQNIGEYEGQVAGGISELYLKKGVLNRLYEEDRERWAKLADKDYVLNRLKESEKGSFTEVFLIKQDNGDYRWTEALIMLMPEDSQQKVLVCLKHAVFEEQPDATVFIKRFLRYGGIYLDAEVPEHYDAWKSFMDQANVKIFWKDADCRFLGASRAFRNYYGFRSDEEFVGKTDEEMGWHLNDAPFESDETRVLKNGEAIVSAHTQNVVGGVAHNILASKFPIYRENKIVGLIGYFVDVDEDVEGNETLREGHFRDPVTGLVNVHGFIETMFELDNNLKTNGQNYMVGMIHVDGYDAVLSDYGDKVAHDLILMLTELLRKKFRSGTLIAKMSGSAFSVCGRDLSYDDLFRSLQSFADEVAQITDVDGFACSLTAKYGVASGSEADNVNRVWEIANQRSNLRKEDKRQSDDGFASPDPYEDLPLSTVVVRPKLDDNGELRDMVFVFANKIYCELTGKSRSELVGKGYLELFPRTDKSWIYLTYRASLGEYIHRKLYDGATHHWLRFTARPSQIPGAAILICDIIDEEKRAEKTSGEDKLTNDAVIEAAKILEGEADYDTAMAEVLRHVGEVTGCERSFILTTDENGVSVPFEWRRDGMGGPYYEPYCMDQSHIAYWEEILKDNSSVVFESVELLREEKPEYYNYFKAHEIEWFINSPIRYDGRMVGYLGIENFRQDVKVDIRKFTESAAYFISARMQIREMSSNEERLSGEKALAARKQFINGKILEITRDIDRLDDEKAVTDVVLRKLGTSFRASRIFILNMDGSRIEHFSEWCGMGVAPMAQVTPEYWKDDYDIAFLEKLRGGKTVVLRDLEQYYEKSYENFLFTRKLARKIIMDVPVMEDDRLVGFIAVVDYDPEDSDLVRAVTEAVAYFTGSRLKSIKQEHEANRLRAVASTTVENPQGGSPAVSGNDEIFMDMPTPCMYLKVILRDSGENRIDDFEYVNVNDAYCKAVKRNREELIGFRYQHVFHNPDPQWMSDIYQAAVNRKTIRDYRFNSLTGHWVYFIAAPAGGPGFCTVTLVGYDRPHQLINELDERKLMNRQTIEVGKVMAGEPVFDVAVNKSLEEISGFMKADYIFMFTIDESGEIESVYDWAAYGINTRDGIASSERQQIRERVERMYDSKKGYHFEEVSYVEGDDPELAEILRKKNIRNTITVPILGGDTYYGFIGANNIDPSKEKLYAEMLNDVSSFIASRISISRKFMGLLGDKFAELSQ